MGAAAALAPTLQVTTPFFGLVLAGWLAVRWRTLPVAAIPGLNGYVLYFALPAMLLRFAATTPITQLLDTGVLASFALTALAVVGIAYVALRRRGLGDADAAFLSLVAAFPNSGFMGVPLLVALLGQAAAAPAIVALAFDMVVTTSCCVALAAGGGRASSRRGVLVASAKRIASNPLPWAIGLGTAMSAGAAAFPPVVGDLVGMLATSASPVALFALGGMLARTAVQRAAAPPGPRATPGHRAAGACGVVAAKLLLHPLLMLAVGRGAIALGVPLDPFAADVLVLIAALPSASNVPMLAERMGADGTRIAQVVLWTTLLAFASFTLAVALIGRTATPA